MDEPIKYSEVDYLNASLDLIESIDGEMRHLSVSPPMSGDLIEFCITAGDSKSAIEFNQKQIECLVDFLSAWLGRRA